MEGIPNIEPYQDRVKEISALMASPNFFQDQRKAARLSREHQKISELISFYEKLEAIDTEIEGNNTLLSDKSTDPELAELAKEDITELEANKEALKQKVLIEMLPPEQSDSRDTIVEVRAGTGGDEASLFAGNLHRMYCRYAEKMGWSIEEMGASPSECGGFKEITFLIKGDDVYKRLKFESGVHRVQRIPVTESGGRIHTSAATVAILPEAEEVDLEIDPNDLEISVCRASGPGGQGVNTTDSAVQILFKPTGMIVTCADERSQTKNKTKAMKVLRSRLLQAKEDEERKKYAEHRKNQIGTGDRSERIRTYNFPQSRLTDHRIGLTLHSLDAIMEGEINEIIEALLDADYKAKIEELINPLKK